MTPTRDVKYCSQTVYVSSYFFKQSNITGAGEKIRIGETNNAGFHVSLSCGEGFSLNKFNL